MVLDAIALAVGLAVAQPGALLAPDVTFRPRERAVSDWRWQAARNLDASPGTRAAILIGPDPASVGRCVRLNNYWCIKRGGWSGEIAADAEGHVAFASAAEGATVAALLLRRYYVDYGRRSALAIVSRWAPAACGVPASAAPRNTRSVPDGLAARGIGRTLRARWLAAHGRRGTGRVRISAVPDRLIGAALPAPAIALGLAAAPVRLPTSISGVVPVRAPSSGRPENAAPIEVGSLGLAAGLPDRPARSAAAGRAAVAPACDGDRSRIANYAARAAAGIASSPTADLALFDVAGQPTRNLARLMRNMAAVEIGPLGAGDTLVDAAVAHAAEVLAARRPGAAGTGGLDQARHTDTRP